MLVDAVIDIPNMRRSQNEFTCASTAAAKRWQVTEFGVVQLACWKFTA